MVGARATPVLGPTRGWKRTVPKKITAKFAPPPTATDLQPDRPTDPPPDSHRPPRGTTRPGPGRPTGFCSLRFGRSEVCPAPLSDPASLAADDPMRRRTRRRASLTPRRRPSVPRRHGPRAAPAAHVRPRGRVAPSAHEAFGATPKVLELVPTPRATTPSADAAAARQVISGGAMASSYLIKQRMLPGGG